MTIADTEQLSESWFKTENLAGLNGTDIEFIDPSTNEGESGIVAVHLITPSVVVKLDKHSLRNLFIYADIEYST
jgi:hypothetical protein